MAYWLSEPVEKLIDAMQGDGREEICDVLVVGSGYGGAIAALRLAGEGRKVLLLERGKEYALGDFPENLGEFPGHVSLTRPGDELPVGYADALFDLRVSKSVAALVGNGLGGTSLINANVALEPDDETMRDPVWPASLRRDLPNLRKAMRRVSDLLGVNFDKEIPGKMRALDRLARSLRTECVAAPIAVNFVGGRNAVGVEQSPCVRCGNCVTGCNTGAKNTLPMNLLPLAKSRGACLYTGATVLSIERAGTIWKVRFRRTATAKSALRGEVHEIQSCVVVLAAGTLGSTEILLRSQARGLQMPAQLGARFSTNGDTLAFGYAQRARVGAVATSGSLDRRQKSVGPTINAYARVKSRERPGGKEHEFLLEDGAIPESLRRVFGELVVSGSLLKRYVKDGQTAWHARHPDRDPLGVQPDALQHSQVLLAMGDDGAEGSLYLKWPAKQDREEAGTDANKVKEPSCPSADDARLAIDWPDDEGSWANKYLDEVDAALTGVEADGFDGGDYVQNLLWRPMPRDFAQALTGKAPSGPLLTVHPLGGCPMGEDASRGVVNGCGQVFRPEGGVFAGLYVMDGAVVPRALGVNPFLTICGIAWRACDQLLEERGWTESTCWEASLIEPERSRDNVPTWPEKLSGALIERLVGDLGAGKPEWFPKQAKGRDLPKRQWLAAEIRIEIPDLDAWAADAARALDATCELYASGIETDAFVRRHHEHVATASGSVRLLAADGPDSDLQTTLRMLDALSTYMQRRGTPKGSGQGLGDTLTGLGRVGRNHAHWRVLDYRFTFKPAGDEKRRTWELKGRKQLAYVSHAPNVWTALTELPVEIAPEGAGDDTERFRGILAVDLVDLARRALILVKRSVHTPATILAMAGVGLLFLRVLFQTHFWSFGAPDYPERRPSPPRLPGSIRSARHGKVAPRCIPLEVDAEKGGKEKINLVLSVYEHPGPNPPREKILLIHGLAHGSNVFTTDTIETPLAAYLFDQGYEPWLLDHRLSPALGTLAERPWNMDQIAQNDIAAAVRAVYVANGNQPINVFAHCIGAGCFSMSVLGGHCHDRSNPGETRSMIKAAAIHAVPPWVVASKANRLRANLAALVKELVGDVCFDPIPPDARAPSFAETAIDRLAGSLPWAASELAAHERDRKHDDMGQAICNRMTLIYGVEWEHGNLSPETHRRIAELVGTANIEIFRQIFFIVQRERLTGRDGTSRYIRWDTVPFYWWFPTLFAHGDKNQVFNPRSSSRSAAMLESARGLPGGHKIGRPELLEVRNYGHMDFLFGNRAHIDVYPHIARFFDATARVLPKEGAFDEHRERLSGTLAGPVLGWSRREAGAVKLRVWLEAQDPTIVRPIRLIFNAIAKDESQRELKETESVEVGRGADSAERYLYLTYDVSVPIGTRRLGISVVYGVGGEDGFERVNGDLQELRRPAGAVELDRPWFRRLESASEKPRDCRFMVGSCRYPGSPFEREAADAIFAAMLKEVRGGADHVLFVGDQIYADATADAFNTEEPVERYESRYREAFKSPNMRQLLNSVPVYMALDDHEFGDNWEGLPRGDDPPAKRQMRPQREIDFGYARNAAVNYQRLVSPYLDPAADPRLHFWYGFKSCGLPFFVMDTRSERELRSGNRPPNRSEMVRPEQMGALRQWLVDHRGEEPKFIVCGSPIGPVSRDMVRQPSLWRNADGWFGYPWSLHKLTELMVEFKPRNLVFLSGDYHLSAVASLAFYCGDRICAEAKQVISSGLFAPLPFANDRPENYVLDEWSAIPVVGSGSSIDIRCSMLTNGQDHFVRIDALQRKGQWVVNATVIGADGTRLATAQVI